MSLAELQPVVEAAWENRDNISPSTTGEQRDAIEATLEALDNGVARVAEKTADGWIVNQWFKKAVLLSFRLNDMEMIDGGPGKPVSEGGRGYACIAEIRMIETIETGEAKTSFMKFGDTVRIEMKDKNGQSIFGSIDQKFVAYKPV